MNLYKFAENSVSIMHVKYHLERCALSFNPPLFTYVDITEYSSKIVKNAETFEIWNENILIGLLAMYLNDPEFKDAFITNISVDNDFQGLGLSKIMLDNAINKAKKTGFKNVFLDVQSENKRALNLYNSRGFFIVEKKKSGFVKMTK
jgi:ribosomal protein S18 acetylase RimI-like enzyme